MNITSKYYFMSIYLSCLLLQSNKNIAKSFVAKFQSDIKGPHLASSNVWMEYLERIPAIKQFTSCLWVKIKYFNFKYAACLWSYCMVNDNKDDMKCLRICIKSVWISANRDLAFSVQIPSISVVEDASQEISPYIHRTWSHLCWRFSATNGANRFYYNGKSIGEYTINPLYFDLAIQDTRNMNYSAFLFVQ